MSTSETQEFSTFKRFAPLVLAILAFPWRAVVDWIYYHPLRGSFHYYVYDDWMTAVPWWMLVALPALVSITWCLIRLSKIRRARLAGADLVIVVLSLALSLLIASLAAHHYLIALANPHAPGYWQTQ